jgi:predicted dehydrogenase
VYDADPGRLDGDWPVVPSLEALLRIEADVAVVLTSHRTHADIAVACLRAGYHTLVEKPLTVTPGEADRVRAEAVRCGRSLAVALQQRTRTEVREARRLVTSGALGRLQRIELVANWPRRSSYFATAPWRGTWRGEAGGIMINQGQHELDLLCHLAGPPAAVTARTRTSIHPVETEDTVAALAEWPGGALGSLYISTATAGEPQRIEVTGTAGRLRLRPGRLEVWRNETDFRTWALAPGDPYAAPRVEPLDPVDGTGGTHVELYRDLAAALVDGRPPIAVGDEAAQAVDLAAALNLSAQHGGTVLLPVDRDGYAELLRRLETEEPAEEPAGDLKKEWR